MDAASLLQRFFLCEQSLVVSQAAWLAAIASYDVKVGLPRVLWEDAVTAGALRERVFELRYPSRLLERDAPSPLLELFDAAIDAPSAEALLLSLARVFKPALLEAYRSYLAQADEIADGPTLRFLRVAVTEKEAQIALLESYVETMLAAAPDRRDEADAWSSALGRQVACLGGVMGDADDVLSATPLLPARRPFQLAEVPARDERFHRCRFYWPDIIVPDYPYGEGIRLQLRSAVSHFNEIWAVETGGAILHAFAPRLGWEFIMDAARWTYDESRHCRMGYERLRQWGFEAHEIPLGTYIYDSARGQEPLVRLGMLFFFETKNIGKKNERIRAFTDYDDHVSRHDMEYDWADETIHAHYGKRWLTTLLQSQPDVTPDDIRHRCGGLVAQTVASASEAERDDIDRVAEAMIARAERLAQR